MKATGIVRRIDDLGRVVIPKEIPPHAEDPGGDAHGDLTDISGEVILKKYSRWGRCRSWRRPMPRRW